MPQHFKFSGTWALSKEHDLIFSFNKWNKKYMKGKLTIKGELIDVKANQLLFKVSSNKPKKSYNLSLFGKWHADKYNRLTFLLKKKQEKKINKLTLKSTFQINKQNQLIYNYTKEKLKTKTKTKRTITFKGFWDITKKDRLLYVLNKNINSFFEFKVSLGKPTPRGLQYEIGIGAVPKKEILTIFGKWKINQKLGVIFELISRDTKPHSILLGAYVKTGEKGRLEFSLKAKKGRNLGINLHFSKKILKNQGELFLKSSLSKKEKKILLGAGFRW
jgi:hypothetical protein